MAVHDFRDETYESKAVREARPDEGFGHRGEGHGSRASEGGECKRVGGQVGVVESRERYVPTGGSCTGVVGNLVLRRASCVERFNRKYIDMYQIAFDGRALVRCDECCTDHGPVASISLHRIIYRP